MPSQMNFILLESTLMTSIAPITMAGKKHKNRSQKPRARAPARELSAEQMNKLPEVGKFWAAQRTPQQPSKTWDSEFPTLPGTVPSESSSKDNWISPADLPHPSGWGTQKDVVDQEGQNIANGWNFGSCDAASVSETTQSNAKVGSTDESLLDTPVTMDTPLLAPEETYWDVGRAPPKKTEEELREELTMKNCEGWPWTGVPNKLITLSPYHLNQHPAESVLSLPGANQESAFFMRLMNVEDVAFMILKLVFRHHDAAWKLASTCQKMWEMMSSRVDIWDMNEGYFGNCDRAHLEDQNLMSPPSVSAQVIVTPLRRPQGRASYLDQIRSIRGLCLSIDNFKDSLRNVQFHGVPFLNINILALLIPQMAKLEILGIYKCHLMHLGSTLRLLDLLTVDRMKGKEHSVHLDFYPNYHLGPKEGGQYSVGTYGVSWDNLDFDSCMGIWSLVKRIVKQARIQGIDFESPHTMFRQWLEKTPCWMVGETLASFRDPTKSNLKIAAMVQYRFSHGSVSWLQQRVGYHCEPKWWGRDVYCKTCRTTQMGVFFDKRLARDNNLTGREEHPRCYGCHLTKSLREEVDHYKAQKRRIVKRWLREEERDPDTDEIVATWNTTNLRKALEDFQLKGIEEMARCLDDQRASDMTKGPDPYDRETQERQRPYTAKETRGLRGFYLRSPDVHAWKNEEAAFIRGGPEWQWHAQSHDKYDGHGRFY